MLLLDNPVQPYPWGQRNGIASALAMAPSGGPEAELWVGTHPRGRSIVAAGAHQGESLASVIAADPLRWLGPALATAGHTALPFLLKILAIAEPLSLQAHPSAEQAVAGFEREQAAGVPIDSHPRVYRDRSPKPEALVALADTFALCGFREPSSARDLVAAVHDPVVAPLLDALGHPDPAEALRNALGWLLRLDGPARAQVARAVGRSAEEIEGTQPPAPRLESPWYWVQQLVQRHPTDPACAAPLLLEVVRVEAGTGIHLPAGNLHAYLRGLGVEIMASSDNVLRGGLTSKHVDVDQLLDVLTFAPGSPPAPAVRQVGAVTVYETAEAAFALACAAPTPGPLSLVFDAPALILPMGSGAALRSDSAELAPTPGQAVCVAPGTEVSLQTTVAVWIASTGDELARW